MGFDFDKTLDSFSEGIKDTAEFAHTKTNEFHENYVSTLVPDCGKYGDAAKFAAEMVPGIAEYNAIKDGDWTAFAIAAGLDIAAIAVGAFTAGAGYAAVKGGSSVAKAGVKVAVKEVAEAGAKKAIKETAEAGMEKATKEVAEAGIKKAVKETAEEGIEKVAKETVEAGTEKAVKEAAEAGAEKVVKEAAEVGVEKAVKETAETGMEKTAKEIAEEGTEKLANPEVLDEMDSQVVKNKLDGIAREEKVLEELLAKHGDDNVIREALLRDKDGVPIKDLVTGEARRIDFIIKKGERIIESIEVTSETASKALQSAKELRILEQAKEIGGAFIRDPVTGKLLEFTDDIVTSIRRLQ